MKSNSIKSNPRASAYGAWKLQLGLLPLGVTAFVLTLTGITLGLSLAIVGIGIPILAGTLAWSAARMKREQSRWIAWQAGGQAKDEPYAAHQLPEGEAAGSARASWKSWFRSLGNPLGYRAAAHQLLGFPIRIALFVVSLTVPLSVFAVMLAPAVYKVSDYLYGYVLYDDATMRMLLPPLSPFERSLVVSGIGVVLMLFVPALIRACGRIYAAWLDFFAGQPELAPPTAMSQPVQSPAMPVAEAAGDWLARAEAAISRYDEDARHAQSPQAH
ncbi:sensor domain-containing protein [Cohnella ginsengisoli]|uniref:Sensor domain-containing protein n=1 Tax=Cohnella ginsengisoli TaxID=425004 RepID=A0A9X4KEN9_9BACL|nr:sensor domain-containing protein [Cohnella ginsengisoli]MDG0790616.1 sensor domain-containing protein [Cohnella ginsengisoli]